MANVSTLTQDTVPVANNDDGRGQYRELTQLDPQQGADPKDRARPIVEVFNSVKGEGVQAGIPMTFIRFAHCNLSCPWCDTPYERVAVRMSDEELYNMVMTNYRPHWVAFTGGEPTLHLSKWLAGRFAANEVMMAIETNGTVYNEALHLMNYIAISPKSEAIRTLGRSSPMPMITPRIIEEVNRGSIHIVEVRWIVDGPGFSPPNPLPKLRQVYNTFSPLMDDAEVSYKDDPSFRSGKGYKSFRGTTSSAIMNRALELVEKYKQQGARLSLQCHKLIGVR